MKTTLAIIALTILSACADPAICPERARQDAIGVLLIGMPLGSMTGAACHLVAQ